MSNNPPRFATMITPHGGIRAGFMPLLFMLCMMLFSREAAPATDDETVHMHGFISQAFIHTTANNFFGSSEDALSTDYAEAGVNAIWHMSPKWNLAGQALVRKAGEGDDGGLRLDYGFAHFTDTLGEAGSTWGVQLGKTKLPYGLYNETRDVAFTRPSILLPQSIYFDRSRDLVMGLTGVRVHGRMPFADGDLVGYLGAGRSDVDDVNIEYAFFQANRAGRFSSDGTMGGKLEYEHDGGRIRIGATLGMLKMNYNGDADPALGSGDISLRPALLFAQYNAEKLSITGEVARQHRQLRGFNMAQYNLEADSLAYYLQATWRVSPNWSVLLRRDIFYSDVNDKAGNNVVAAGLPVHLSYSKDWTLGMRHDLSRNWMFAAEWHHVDGTFLLPQADNPDNAKLKRNWDMLLIQFAYRF